MTVKKIDLIIIDIDDTFLYHRTVAIANKLFVESILGGKEEILTTGESIRKILRNPLKIRFNKKTLMLAKTGVQLHLMNIYREITEKSSEKLIRKWAKTVVKIEVREEDYKIDEKTLKKKIYPKILKIYNKLRQDNPGIKIIALSEHFKAGKDPIVKILGIDKSISNEFLANNKGIIDNYQLNIKNSNDKLMLAKKTIKEQKAKSIGLVIQDYDDLGLLELDNIKSIVYSRKLRKYVKNINCQKIMF
ncbi:MAG: hypothetical protein ABII01_00955 [Candidatus Woesearchaeota archaeon]